MFILCIESLHMCVKPYMPSNIFGGFYAQYMTNNDYVQLYLMLFYNIGILAVVGGGIALTSKFSPDWKSIKKDFRQDLDKIKVVVLTLNYQQLVIIGFSPLNLLVLCLLVAQPLQNCSDFR